MADKELWSNKDGDFLTEGALSGSLRIFERGDLVNSVDAGGAVVIAAIEQLRAKLAETQECYDAACEAGEQLRTKLTIAEEDTARLDWLQKDERELWIRTTCCDSEWVVSEWGDQNTELGSGQTLRAAIDEAREGE